MIHEGFDPDFPPGTDEQIASLKAKGSPAPADGIRDLRQLLWSSIDNDSSRDLDQIEVAERVDGGIKVLIGIADVDSDVPLHTPIDQHASSQTTTVYTGIRTFPMLPEELSTDLTSLNEAADRLSIVIEFIVDSNGCLVDGQIYRALVRNRAQLTYNGVGPWLENRAPAPAKVAASADLQAQLRLQDEAATALRSQRHRLGALDFDRVEAEPVVSNSHVEGIAAREPNQASRLIEDFMIAANEVMASSLAKAGVSAIRRVVKDPERWPRIVEIAARYGEHLPPAPDPGALSEFLRKRRAADEIHYADLSLSIIKLMGPGEYVLARAGEASPGHFGLAVQNYTHSTAPNRRFSDLVTQRLVKAMWAREKQPYTDDELAAIARNCTLKEDAARKVQRSMNKRIAAVAMRDRVGQTFSGIVTGVTPKGVFVRVLNPPVEGRLVQGEHGVDVGDRVNVKLSNTDPERGYIDFVR
ncbi:MAG TPA: RNB domain-containing ribonuclease [Bryobacteraceae bacterium]|nr:RNB domain-containing ribonuclease [Bryobacteraceae bacterium]